MGYPRDRLLRSLLREPSRLPWPDFLRPLPDCVLRDRPRELYRELRLDEREREVEPYKERVPWERLEAGDALLLLI